MDLRARITVLENEVRHLKNANNPAPNPRSTKRKRPLVDPVQASISKKKAISSTGLRDGEDGHINAASLPEVDPTSSPPDPDGRSHSISS